MMAAVVDDGVGHVWCVWDRGDRHVQLPFVAFTHGAKWGSRPASVRRLGRRVAAYSIRVSGGSRDCLGSGCTPVGSMLGKLIDPFR